MTKDSNKSTLPSGKSALLNKHELAAALGVNSHRIVDAWVRKRMISFYPLGHRTLLFDLEQVLEDLARFEVKAVGRTRK